MTVHVMTGPLYTRPMEPLPNADEPHRVPSGYWKVVIAHTGHDSFEHAAFIMDQNSRRKDRVSSKSVTIDEVEKQSGLDLLWELPDAEEDRVESDRNMDWVTSWADR